VRRGPRPDQKSDRKRDQGHDSGHSAKRIVSLGIPARPQNGWSTGEDSSKNRGCAGKCTGGQRATSPRATLGIEGSSKSTIRFQWNGFPAAVSDQAQQGTYCPRAIAHGREGKASAGAPIEAEAAQAGLAGFAANGRPACRDEPALHSNWAVQPSVPRTTHVHAVARQGKRGRHANESRNGRSRAHRPPRLYFMITRTSAHSEAGPFRARRRQKEALALVAGKAGRWRLQPQCSHCDRSSHLGAIGAACKLKPSATTDLVAPALALCQPSF